MIEKRGCRARVLAAVGVLAAVLPAQGATIFHMVDRSAFGDAAPGELSYSNVFQFLVGSDIAQNLQISYVSTGRHSSYWVALDGMDMMRFGLIPISRGSSGSSSASGGSSQSSAGGNGGSAWRGRSGGPYGSGYTDGWAWWGGGSGSNNGGHGGFWFPPFPWLWGGGHLGGDPHDSDGDSGGPPIGPPGGGSGSVGGPVTGPAVGAPEPATMLLMGAGFVALGLLRRRRAK